MKLTGENRVLGEKPVSSTTSSTTNLTWTDPGSNPGLQRGQVTRPRYGHEDAILLKQVLSVCDHSFKNYRQKRSGPSVCITSYFIFHLMTVAVPQVTYFRMIELLINFKSERI
jgi:hypothetical protein